jgi:hypothetical protein
MILDAASLKDDLRLIHSHCLAKAHAGMCLNAL